MRGSRARRPIDYLLIDISNSYTKLAYSTKTRIARPVRLPTRDFTATTVKNFLRRSVHAIVVSSVVPTRNSAIRRAAGRVRVIWLSAKIELGVGVDYPSPATIGADRLANAAAVSQLYGHPAIVVDFGTAVTFDIISTRGAYIGGVIAPGLEAMTNFLYQRTALLPRLTLREPASAIGRTTRNAMLAGAVFGYRGLVQEIIARVEAEQFPRKKPYVVATGGYAKLIAARVPAIQAVHPHLTLEGLRLVGNLNV